MSKRKETLEDSNHFSDTVVPSSQPVLTKLGSAFKNNPRQPRLCCLSPTSGHPLSCLGISSHTNLSKKKSPCPHNSFFRGTCSSGQLYYCKSWLKGQSRNK